MTRKVATIGNTTFPTTLHIGAQIVDVLKGYGEDVVFLTRGVGALERFVATAAIVLGLRCFEFKGAGGASNLERDAELVAACDELVAFLDPAVLDDAHSGTAMVIERALAAGRPVRAASVVEGSLVWADG